MQVAALAAGMSERSAYKYKSGPLPSSRREPRSWRTRKDPFEEVWAELIEPLLAADEDGELQSTELIKMLMEKRPGQFSSGQVRTLQRRVTEWRRRASKTASNWVKTPGAAGRSSPTRRKLVRG